MVNANTFLSKLRRTWTPVHGITSAILQISRDQLILKNHLKLKQFNAHPDALNYRVVTTPKTVSKYKTVRSWVTRRVNNAFTEALRDKGFDKLGRRVDGPENAGHSSAGQLESLTGTVIVQLNANAVTIKFGALKKEMDLAVDAVAKFCSKNKDGRGNWKRRPSLEPR
ncbi:hypothetical protein FGG08_005185 [Glutinoglossum americanum]|uniref:Uncharacterized protein n=1 Tax=Glutinoglossum americanum TaxID=1670608 RepID=A0A9P8L1P4_9PEZI|nr:hypothetical protein FGG08_005185 [Glutinoglossum americanum]